MNSKHEPLAPRARLAASRAQLLALLAPVTTPRAGASPGNGAEQFPRSATMRFLTNLPGKGALGVLLLGYLASRRASIGRWGRYLSVASVVGKALITRALNGRTTRH